MTTLATWPAIPILCYEGVASFRWHQIFPTTNEKNCVNVSRRITSMELTSRCRLTKVLPVSKLLCQIARHWRRWQQSTAGIVCFVIFNWRWWCFVHCWWVFGIFIVACACLCLADSHDLHIAGIEPNALLSAKRRCRGISTHVPSWNKWVVLLAFSYHHTVSVATSA